VNSNAAVEVWGYATQCINAAISEMPRVNVPLAHRDLIASKEKSTAGGNKCESLVIWHID
jgi:hypothetical protein